MGRRPGERGCSLGWGDGQRAGLHACVGGGVPRCFPYENRGCPVLRGSSVCVQGRCRSAAGRWHRIPSIVCMHGCPHAHASMHPVHTAAKVMGLLATPKPMHALSHAVARSDACVRARVVVCMRGCACVRPAAPVCTCTAAAGSTTRHEQQQCTQSACLHALLCPISAHLRARACAPPHSSAHIQGARQACMHACMQR